MADVTAINPNLVLKATETSLYEEYFNEMFWEKIAVDAALEEDGHMAEAPESIMIRKSEKLKMGVKYIEFGLAKQLEGRGTYEGETLAGNEEKIKTNDNAVYFSTMRHGVPFPLKELDAHFNQAFDLLQKRQRLLSTWFGRNTEQWHWQSWVFGCNNEANRVHGDTDSPQRFHPNVYTIDSAGITNIPWNATEGTYRDSVAAAINAQAPGDNITVAKIWEMEVVAADLNLRKIPFSIDGRTENLWMWVYPRAARTRIRTALQSYFLEGDVRGPGNRTLEGDKFKFGQFIFCEAAWIPRVTQTGGSGATLALQESWYYNAATNRRIDQRADVQGVLHGIMGADTLCLAEPESLQYDFERTDYKAKEGIGAYCLKGSRRGETYDNRLSATSVLNQSSILVIEHNTTT